MTSSSYLIPINAHPVDVPTPVSARFPNARPATATAYLGEHVVICDGCMGTVKAIHTVGDTRIVGVVHEDKNDHELHWFSIPLFPEWTPEDDKPIAYTPPGWTAVETDADDDDVDRAVAEHVRILEERMAAGTDAE